MSICAVPFICMVWCSISAPQTGELAPVSTIGLSPLLVSVK